MSNPGRAKSNIAVVSVIFNSDVGHRITKDVSTTWYDILSSVGGTLGLCTGFSVLSLFELFYYLGRGFSAKHVIYD